MPGISGFVPDIRENCWENNMKAYFSFRPAWFVLQYTIFLGVL
jgi:hypothetical protein